MLTGGGGGPAGIALAGTGAGTGPAAAAETNGKSGSSPVSPPAAAGGGGVPAPVPPAPVPPAPVNYSLFMGAAAGDSSPNIEFTSSPYRVPNTSASAATTAAAVNVNTTEAV